jgi:hypothetical protein
LNVVGLTASIVLAIGAVVLRGFPGFQHRVLLGSDRDFHLTSIDLLRTTRGRVPERDDAMIGPGILNYPLGYHRLLALLPDSTVRWLDRFSALLFDATLSAGCSVLLIRYTDISVAAAIALGGTYLLVPGLSLLHIGPRAYSLSPRSFSQLLVGGGILLLAGRDAVGIPLLADLAVVILLTWVLWSSLFALQFLIFVWPVAGAIAWSARPFVLLVIAMACALAFSPRRFPSQLRGHLDLIRWYARHGEQFLIERGGLSDLPELVRRRDWRRIGGLLTYRNAATSGLIRHAVVFGAVAGYIIVRPTEGWWLAWLGGVAIAALVPWVVTNIGIARILGESERYLEFSMPAAWVVFWAAFGIDSFLPAIVAVLAYCGIFYAINTWQLYGVGRLAQSIELEERAAVSMALADRAPCNVLCLDTADSYWVIDRSHGVRVCMHQGWTHGEPFESFVGQLFRHYPHLHPDTIDSFAQRYRIDYLLVRVSSQAQATADLGFRYRLAHRDRLFSSSLYEIYRCSRSPIGDLIEAEP